MSDHASRCKAIREAQGLSQNGFARIIGTTQATIDNWEKGRIPNGPAQLILMIANFVTEKKTTMIFVHIVTDNGTT